jgi:hypothetical protein
LRAALIETSAPRRAAGWTRRGHPARPSSRPAPGSSDTKAGPTRPLALHVDGCPWRTL